MSTDHDHDQEHVDARAHTRAPEEEHAQPEGVHELASTLGNRGVEQVLRSTAVQRAGATSHQELDEAVARSIESRRGGGSPLDESTRTDLEGAFGQDLSDVRVHTDSTADELSHAVQATAFTSGSDVFFRSGTYDPGTSDGRELIGHETAHVLQQREGTSGLADGEVSHPHDAAEQEAEAIGAEVASATAEPAAPATATAGVSRAADEQVQREAMEEEEEMPMGVQREAMEEEEELMM